MCRKKGGGTRKFIPTLIFYQILRWEGIWDFYPGKGGGLRENNRHRGKKMEPKEAPPKACGIGGYLPSRRAMRRQASKSSTRPAQRKASPQEDGSWAEKAVHSAP